MKRIKLLFQGDSITDAGRDYTNPHNLGNGYPSYAAKNLICKYPAIEFDFIDLGISGNTTESLVNRLQNDFIDIQPDIVSILVGINDCWRSVEKGTYISKEVFEHRYRTVLNAIKQKTNAKIMMMEPFFIPVKDRLSYSAGVDENYEILFAKDLAPKIEIVRKLAREYADVYLPTDGLLQSAFVCNDARLYSEDGVHPNAKGAEFIGQLYTEYVSKLIDTLV